MQDEFEDTKGVVRIHKSKKDRQHNVQNKKYKQQSFSSSLDIQYSFKTKHTHKTKHRVPRTPLKTGVKSGAPEVWNGLHQTCVGHIHLNYSCIQRHHDNIARKYERETNTKITTQMKKFKTCETLNRITLSPTTTSKCNRQQQ